MDYWYYNCCCETPIEPLEPENPSSGCTCVGITGPSGTGVSGAYIDATGNLHLIYTDSTDQDLGNVVGPSGASGPGFSNAEINNGNLEVTTTSGDIINCGAVVPEPKINTPNNAIYQVPDGFNTFINTVDNFAIRITLPSTGNYIGEIFTVCHQVPASGGSEQSSYIMTTNTSMTTDLALSNANGGAAFIWNGHFWQPLT
jgi:hypothetical protein